MHQTGHCYIFLIERELESCRMLILRAGRLSFTRVPSGKNIGLGSKNVVDNFLAIS